MHILRLIRLHLILAFLFFFNPSFSSEILEEIQVSDRENYNEFDFGSYIYFQNDEFNLNNVFVSEELKNSPLMITSSNGGIGSRTSYFIRGAESRHVLFSLDGMKLNDPSTVDRQFDDSFLDNSFLKEMIIYRGPKSTIYGSDAVGGMIDFKSSKGENAPHSKFTFSGGSFGTAKINVQKDWKSKQSQGSVGSNFLRSDGISKLNKKRFKAKERDALQNIHIYSSSEHEISSFLKTDFILTLSENKQELDGYQKDTSSDRSTLIHTLIQQKTHYQKSKKVNLSLRNGFSRYHRSIKTLNEGNNQFQGDLQQNEITLDLKNKTWRGLLGLNHENEKMQVDEINKSLDTFSFFNQNKFVLSTFDYQLGMRLDHHPLFGNLITGTTGFHKRILERNVKLQYSVGFKSPTLYQLYGPSIMGMPVGNQNLDPEKIDSLEISLEEKYFDISLFQKDFKKLITYSQVGYLNQDDFKARGIELLGKLSLESYSFKPFISITDYAEGESPILRRPSVSYGVNFFYTFQEKFDMGLNLRGFSSRMDLDTSGKVVRLAGYEVLDFNFLYLYNNISYGFKVNNLLDREFEEIYGYSVMPRSFSISVSFIL